MITTHTVYGEKDISYDILFSVYRKFVESLGQSIPIEMEINRAPDVPIADPLNGYYGHLPDMLPEKEFEAVANYLHKYKYPSPRKTRILDTHGGTLDGEFCYFEVLRGLVREEYWAPVNKWLDTYDGKYDALFVKCCNPDGIRLNPRRYSFVIYSLDINRNNEIFDAGNPSFDYHGPLVIIPPTNLEK